MDNPQLEKRSRTFLDDTGCRIDKRCFGLIVGDEGDPKSNAFELSAQVNIFEDRNTQRKLDSRSHVLNIIFELCPQNLKSMTLLIPEFKALFRYQDLHLFDKQTLRVIELSTPLYYLKQ